LVRSSGNRICGGRSLPALETSVCAPVVAGRVRIGAAARIHEDGVKRARRRKQIDGGRSGLRIVGLAGGSYANRLRRRNRHGGGVKAVRRYGAYLRTERPGH